MQINKAYCFKSNVIMRCILKKNRLYTLFAVVAACFLLVVIPASSVSITESPDTINRGGQVSITMNDLRDGSQFSILIDGEFNTLPGERFSFQTTGFTMPVSLNNGQISATTRGTSLTGFSAKKGGTTVNNVQQADGNGFYSFSQPTSITSGVYDYIKLEGSARSDVSTITTSMNLLGIKKGPDNSQITFSIDGIDNGLVRVTVLVDGQTALPTKTITVGGGLIPETTTETTTVPTTTTPVPTSTTTAATTTTTTVTATGTTQTTTTETQTGNTTAATTTVATTIGTATAATTTADITTGTATAATTTTAPPKTFYSADQKVSLVTRGIDYAGFLMVRGAAIPADWLAISDIYTIAPDTLVFSPQATLTFTIPKASGADYAYFIGKYENNQWTAVPSAAGTNTIETEIGHPGIYGLMAYRPESTLPATVVKTAKGGVPAEGTSPAAQVTVKGTPRIASVAAAATPRGSATQAPWLPLDPLLVFGALAICCALVLRRE
jgi:hypothetical protein